LSGSDRGRHRNEQRGCQQKNPAHDCASKSDGKPAAGAPRRAANGCNSASLELPAKFPLVSVYVKARPRFAD
jgi:hypothetical protein